MLPDLTVLLALLAGLGALGSRLDAGTESQALLGVAVTLASATWLIRNVANRAIAALREGDTRVAEAGRMWTGTWALLGFLGALYLFQWGALVTIHVPRVYWLGAFVVTFLPAAWLFGVGWRERGRIERAAFQQQGREIPPALEHPVRGGVRRNGIALLPILLIYGLIEAIWVAGALGVEWARVASIWLEVMPLLALGVSFGIILVFLPILPWIIHRLLRGQPLPDGRIRRLLEQGSKRIGLKYRDIVLWRTNKRVVNAMVVGFTRGTRRIFLTDGIIHALTEDELLAVFFHEAGHVKRWHLPLLLTVFFSLGMLFHVLHGPLVAAGIPPMMVVLLQLAVLWYGVLGFLSRRFEREADLYGAEHANILTPEAPAVEMSGLPRPIPRGAALMMRALDRVRQVSGRGSSHRHGTIDARMTYIAAHATNPAVREAFHRDRRNLLLGITGLLALATGLIAASYPSELAAAKARISLQAGIRLYAEAADATAVGDLSEAAPLWQQAHDNFVEAAGHVEDETDLASQEIWVQARWNAGDAALHGLGASATARAQFEMLLARLKDVRGLGRVRHRLLFGVHIDLGRITAFEHGKRTDAEAHLQAARTNELRRVPSDELSDTDLAEHNYMTERLRLLEATIDARLAGAEGEEAARPILEMLSRSANPRDEWVELRADAQIELKRLGPAKPNRDD